MTGWFSVRQVGKWPTESSPYSGVVKTPVMVTLETEVGREFWGLETDEFHKKLEQEAEEGHAEEIQGWEQSKAVPNMPWQFHQ